MIGNAALTPGSRDPPGPCQQPGTRIIQQLTLRSRAPLARGFRRRNLRISRQSPS